MHVDDTTTSPPQLRTKASKHPDGTAGHARRGRLLLATLAALALCLAAARADASWTISQARFHASAHASLSCADCHGDIVPGKDHPNPADVTKPLAAFFRTDTCLGCHADVADALKKGVHGGKALVANQDYGQCIRCHDPHLQPAKNRPAAFDPAKPVEAQCGVCHAKRDKLPPLGKDDTACMACHAKLAPGDPARRATVDRLCLSCHADTAPAGTGARLGMPTMNKTALAAATHKNVACLDCHHDGARFPHDRQSPVACRQCHVRHDEKTLHDAHMSVTCQACHLSGTQPVKEATTGRIVAKIDPLTPGSLVVHTMTLPAGDASCRRCHTPGNALGASAMVLPAKGLTCLPCHAATFSVSDPITGLSLLVFVAGMAVLAFSWFSGAGLGPATPQKQAENEAPATGHETRPIAWARLWETAFYDIFLQRRLHRQSRRRWAVHALIFFPFVFRFLWGLAGLLGSLWTPGSSLPWLLLDKNNPVGAFLFDASGLALLVGLVLAAANWAQKPAEEENVPGLPERDWPALVLLLALTVAGFLLEGLRIAMTGFPAGSGAAFLGYGLAAAFGTVARTSLEAVYGYAWYAHAILTGLVVAYLPFSQLRHIVTAPLSMLLGARGKHE